MQRAYAATDPAGGIIYYATSIRSSFGFSEWGMPPEADTRRAVCLSDLVAVAEELVVLLVAAVAGEAL